MIFGLVLGPFFPSRLEMSSESAFALQMSFCDRAAESGFDAASFGHHYLSGPDAQFFQPLLSAAYVLAKHPDLSVATTIFILPYHNPVEIAEQVATLDAMAPGRFILGVGQGYRAAEAEGAGIEQFSRGGRLAECIAAMRLLWGEGPSSFDGKYFSFHDADTGIRPRNLLGPPILIGADTTKTIAAVPALGGDFWVPSPRNSVSFIKRALPVYKQALGEVGREFTGLPLLRMAHLTDDEAAGRSQLEQSFGELARIQTGWGQPGERSQLSFEELKKEKILFGSPDEVAEGLISLNREIQAEAVFMSVYLPGMDPNAALDMVSRIGEEVLPVVRREVGRASLFDR